jgi:hypothetical protein
MRRTRVSTATRLEGRPPKRSIVKVFTTVLASFVGLLKPSWTPASKIDSASNDQAG